ncbi:hypothetical protein H9K75_03170 [Diaphorobacter aerolatus]|uniref:Amino acid transporter n=2 Tax=Diaphorobacter aerolatus TaxID=1288495 RepID=A0A7H0GQ12_9BURK|nr:hypothetical protein H9K75_03170 [Diaphorobacter aerolatus]
MQWLDLLQWPAFAASLWAAWLVAAKREHARNIGFWIFLASNVLWIAWGVHTRAYALVALQVGLAILNVRGLKNTEEQQQG